MSARGPSRRTRNMRRTCLVFHCTPGLARTEALGPGRSQRTSQAGAREEHDHAEFE
jgi:hypothetical protein